MPRIRVVSCCVGLLVCGLAHPQDDEVAKALRELNARPFASGAPLSLSKILEAVESQTGSPLRDRRTTKSDPVLRLRGNPKTYWEAAAAIADAVGCGLSVYDPAGPALVDGVLPASQSVALDGIVRIALKRWTLVRDEETGTHSAHVALDVAWEPRFEPFYLEVRPAKASVEKKKYDIAGQGRQSVAGRRATEILLRMPAPPRAATHVDALEGELRFVGPSRMLEFAFGDASAPAPASQDGVTVSIKPAPRNPWAFDVAIRNPPGGPVFESFQSWLDNNRIRLERTSNGKKEWWEPDPASEELQGMLTAENAKIRYTFEGTQGKGQPKQWSLHYRTPGRIVEWTARYRFEKLELP